MLFWREFFTNNRECNGLTCKEDEIINQYKNTMNSKIYLSEEGLGFLRNFVYDKQTESDKILHL